MNEALDAEILSYREFKNRETLLAWERRRRAFESLAGHARSRAISRAAVTGILRLLRPPNGASTYTKAE